MTFVEVRQIMNLLGKVPFQIVTEGNEFVAEYVSMMSSISFGVCQAGYNLQTSFETTCGNLRCDSVLVSLIWDSGVMVCTNFEGGTEAKVVHAFAQRLYKGITSQGIETGIKARIRFLTHSVNGQVQMRVDAFLANGLYPSPDKSFSHEYYQG
ncbi:unnamed protein product [Clavelina lepadiformis]|uniref:Uncharacterized protein n=1 Tax=Clavelina lepadiformis TaxID=159417 RepID=A0ABP0F293_CLALP